MSRFFGSVNMVLSHNKSWQSDLAMEKLWVMQCGWLRLCTTVATGMAINSCWKMFCYWVKMDHYAKFISIREFLERLAMDSFSNTFTTDTWTLAKIIPYLYRIYNKWNVSTCRSLNYSSSSTLNSEISIISEITIATANTTDIGHTVSKEVEKEVGRHNMADRGYCNRISPNGKRCLNSSLWYWNDC